MNLSAPHRRRHSRIEIIPLIDIMFFLLASFMMLSLSMDRTQNIKVELPSATQAQHDFTPNMLNIAVDKSGKVWFQKEAISLLELGTVVSNRFRADTNLPVYICGDRDAMHGAMVDVYQIVRAAGVQKVAFAVGEKENPATP